MFVPFSDVDSVVIYTGIEVFGAERIYREKA